MGVTSLVERYRDRLPVSGRTPIVSLGEGSTDIKAVPVRRMGDLGPRIEEEYALDEHGMVAVTIRNLDSGYQRVFRVGA